MKFYTSFYDIASFNLHYELDSIASKLVKLRSKLLSHVPEFFSRSS